MTDRGAWIQDPDPSCDVGSGSGLSTDVDPVKIRQWIRNATTKGRRQKKVVLLGGAHHKVAHPPSCGQSTTFLWDFFFA